MKNAQKNAMHLGEPGIYYVVYAILMGLFILTWVAAYLPLGSFQLAVGLTIASVKLGLIALYFMELRKSRPLAHLFSTIGIVWLGILLVLSMTDYVSRNWLQEPSPWPQSVPSPEIAVPRQVGS